MGYIGFRPTHTHTHTHVEACHGWCFCPVRSVFVPAAADMEAKALLSDDFVARFAHGAVGLPPSPVQDKSV